MQVNNVNTDVVVFFEGEHVTKEMLYVEFEAVLDQVVGIAEFANMQRRAAFVRVDRYLDVTGVVFFLVNFGDDGYADPNWNVPLQHMAETSGQGPDIGSGKPIRLACRSQCNVPWHQRDLWDPDLNQHQTLLQLQKRLKENRLCLIVPDDVETNANSQLPTLTEVADSSVVTTIGAEQQNNIRQQLEREYKEKLITATREQQIQIATLKSSLKSRAEDLHKRFSGVKKRMQEELILYKGAWDDEKRKNLLLKEKLQRQVSDLHDERESFTKKLVRSQKVGDEQFEEYKERLDRELSAKFQADTVDLQEQLDMKEVELCYREEQLKGAKSELDRLRAERQRLMQDSSGQLLKRMEANGISFIAYEPGIDHLAIPLEELSLYLEDKEDYVAEKCGVEPEHYKAWLSHYTSPTCCAESEGSVCGSEISRINYPAQFIEGVHDCCPIHSYNQSDIFGDEIDKAI